MTTEAACLSTVWITDQSVKQWFSVHGRPQDYRELRHDKDALYDVLIEIDLGEIESMIALPFHPSNVFTIHSLSDNESFLEDVLESVEKDAAVRSGGLTFTLRDKIQNHRLTVQQAVVGGCVGGTYENLWALKEILGDYIIPADGVPLGVYPASQAVLSEAEKQGVLGALIGYERPCDVYYKYCFKAGAYWCILPHGIATGKIWCWAPCHHWKDSWYLLSVLRAAFNCSLLSAALDAYRYQSNHLHKKGI